MPSYVKVTWENATESGALSSRLYPLCISTKRL